MLFSWAGVKHFRKKKQNLKLPTDLRNGSSKTDEVQLGAEQNGIRKNPKHTPFLQKIGIST